MTINTPNEGAVSQTWTMAKHAQAVQAFCQAFDRMPGHAPSALLEDVLDVAKRDFEFEGTIDDAILVLQSSPALALLCIPRQAFMSSMPSDPRHPACWMGVRSDGSFERQGHER